MEIIARNPADISQAYARYYAKLADTFVAIICSNGPKTVLEAGAGKGQLTIPLLERLPRKIIMISVDSSRSPYTGWLDELAAKVKHSSLENRIRLVNSDARDMKEIANKSIDALVSNELICDLSSRDQLNSALTEFHRVLKTGGVMIHGEWSSWHDRQSERVTARHSPAWNPDQLFEIFDQKGFHTLKTHYFDTTIRFDYEAALEELRTWGAAGKLAERRILNGHKSLFLPFEHIIESRK